MNLSIGATIISLMGAYILILGAWVSIKILIYKRKNKKKE